jgi:hypothetical protein
VRDDASQRWVRDVASLLDRRDELEEVAMTHEYAVPAAASAMRRR